MVNIGVHSFLGEGGKGTYRLRRNLQHRLQIGEKGKDSDSPSRLADSKQISPFLWPGLKGVSDVFSPQHNIMAGMETERN
eukprot:scaffold3780_cov110-Skeletonema_marinoi.AAC.1